MADRSALRVALHKDAIAEAGAAREWYEARSAATAEAFMEELDRVVARINVAVPASRPIGGPMHKIRAQESAEEELVAAGMVVTIGLHGIPLKAALELVAGQTGLQISPRPDGVAFVQPGLSLDRAQAHHFPHPRGQRGRLDDRGCFCKSYSRASNTRGGPAGGSHEDLPQARHHR